MDASSEPRLEVFEQLSGDQADVLFWIEPSGSMGDDLALVAAHAADFAQALGDIWTPATPDLGSELKSYTYRSRRAHPPRRGERAAALRAAGRSARRAPRRRARLPRDPVP